MPTSILRQVLQSAFMADMPSAQEKADRIVADLKKQGLPVLRASAFDAGWKIGVAFTLPNGRYYAFRLPTAEASAWAFEKLYRDHVSCPSSPATR